MSFMTALSKASPSGYSKSLLATALLASSFVFPLPFYLLPGTPGITPASAQTDDSKLQPVIVEKVISSDISQQLRTSGEILSYQGADIHPKIGGEVIKVNVRESSVVKSGDVLAEIDHRILDAQLEQAQAAVTVARASVEVQEVLVKTSESALVSAKAQAAAAKAKAVNMAATKKRYEELFREGAVSEQQLDDVRTQYDAADAQNVSAETNIRQAEDSIRSNQVTLKVRRAQLAQAESNLHAAEVQRENAFVKAPFDGRITMRVLDAGAMANPAQPIFRLEQMNRVKVVGSLVEKDLMQLQAGKTEASVRVDTFADREFKGMVTSVYPAITSKTRTGQFEVVLENPEIVLRSGMYATIILSLQTEKNAVVVPKDALLTHNGQTAVIHVTSEGMAVRKPVRVGIVQETRAQILEGLRPGDLIITQGAELVKTGIRVKPVLMEGDK
ncbi:MAG TPA: efflux RND transporter periplasmic adaptor subunit [Candidatus Ozemobacteraceae bacterium]|nr:efflux RND transporter periplasmic adaptor subunit [Candidatus Ozemobacteraceae bacterium]